MEPLTKKQRRDFMRVYREIHRGDDRECRLARRADLARKIARLAEGGEVAIVYGGVDCDGGRWDDCVSIVPASAIAVEAWERDYHEGAEGPQWTQLMRPSSTEELTVIRRDLALEAFEDGHPHTIYA